jgi:hypothetical protein
MIIIIEIWDVIPQGTKITFRSGERSKLRENYTKTHYTIISKTIVEEKQSWWRDFDKPKTEKLYKHIDELFFISWVKVEFP